MHIGEHNLKIWQYKAKGTWQQKEKGNIYAHTTHTI
jgi:hypothetical protein